MYFFTLACVFVGFFAPVVAIVFKDVTSDVFPTGHFSGLIAAFGDLNSDKLTDVFSIAQNGKTLEILLADENKPYLGSSTVKCTLNAVITGVVPGDFNGDSLMDILVVLQREGSSFNELVVLWGLGGSINCSNIVVFKTIGHPFVVDYNNDLIPDIIGEDEGKVRSAWLSNFNKTFTKISITSSKIEKLQMLRVPHSSAVLDLNDDLVSDIIITGENKVEQWFKEGEKFVFNGFIAYPKAVALGQSTFVEFNSDGPLNHIMPICKDTHCQQSAVMLWNNFTSSWETLIENFSFDNMTWGFKLQGKTVLETAALPVTLRAGDFNMDGFPDFITVLQAESKPITRAVIFENVPCNDCTSGRNLTLRWNIPGLIDMLDVEIVTFYDLFEDGRLDIIASSKKANEWQINVLQNMDTYDAYFIKVLVLSGLCYTDCALSRIPYGVNQPGPMIRCNTTKADGGALVSIAVQMSQSAHFPLQLPYSLFGLGQTPNFVDHLTVAITKSTSDNVYKHEWPQIIPNSQMVVIPYPPYNSEKWVKKLFVTPSHLVLLTFIALVGTCGFIAIIILILHWKERREDKKEKMQNAYRFHFDAM